MANAVLDAHALLAYLERESGFAVVRDLLAQALKGDAALFMTTVNVGEVLYIVRREQGMEKAEEIEAIIHTLPVSIIDVDLGLARETARFKAAAKMSYADCFAAALASIKRASLVTGDPEFKAVEDEIDVIWLEQ
jgi:predicted nucleic acid-binding protein